jgi:hypothetical protein
MSSEMCVVESLNMHPLHKQLRIFVPCSQESYGQHTGTWSTSTPERSYLTITTVPSLNKCQDCLKVAASYEEEGKKSSTVAEKQMLRMCTELFLC